METTTEPKAISIAIAHAEASCKHDWEAAKAFLAADVKFTVVTNQPVPPPLDINGIDRYKEAFKTFTGVVPGSTKIAYANGDDNNALIVVRVKVVSGPGAPEMNFTASRLYYVNDEGKIQTEHLTFYAVPA
jgi:ketosteroid isomerase-like protein